MTKIRPFPDWTNAERYPDALIFKAPDSEWINIKSSFERILLVEDQEIILMIEPKEFIHSTLGKIGLLNISFVTIDKNGKRIKAARGKNKHGSKLIGALANAILEKIKEDDLDASALLFNASNKRSLIYKRIIRNNFGWSNLYGGSWDPGTKLDSNIIYMTAFKNEIDRSWHKEFYEWLRKQKKI